MYAINVDNVTKFFSVINEDKTASGFTAVSSVSLKIETGKIISLLGPSGCGKTTFLEMLGGLQAPTEGSVYVDGKLVLETPPSIDSTKKEKRAYKRKYRFISPLANSMWRNRPKHDIAMMFQDYAVFPWMTVFQNVIFALKLRNVPKRERRERALHQLKKVGLDNALSKYPAQLSGGMKQRLALARALAVQPKVILMDEPFAAVDILTRERLQDELLKLIDETDITIVLVTHDISEAVYLSDEIVVFSANPGTIRNKFTLDIKRPRRRNSSEALEYEERIQSLLKYETKHLGDYAI
ncbi:MAG: ABC transporter ATP-binding protein [Oscillospiraceae bacterium]|nr:ABC transporter ATP-binding protein [Oscillospiraceae bacterium]